MRNLSLYQLVCPTVVALIVSCGLLIEPVAAQEPAGQRQELSEQQLLDELGKIQGRVSIPDPKATTLQQPQGRDYQTFERTAFPWVAGFVIVGLLLLIGIY